MKNVLRLLAVAALATMFALPAFAQDAAATPAASGPCAETDAKAALYNKFRENFKGTPDQQKVAYESGREYLSKYGTCPDAGDKQIAAYVQNWVGKYEKAVVEFNFGNAVKNNPGQAFQLSRDILARNPDNLNIYLQLITAGLNASGKGDKSHNAEAANAARRALQLVEQGKTSENWFPLISQADAPAGLRYYIAAFTFDTAPEEAATQLLKVAQSGTAFAKEPATYQLLGASYYNGEFKKLAAEYKEKYEGKEETPESKALYDRINVVLDRVIDAYARAVALSNGKTNYATINTQAKTALTAFYKQRHENSDAGLNELIASVLSRPIPVPGQDPVAAPSTPTGTSSVSGTDGAAGTTARPAAAATTTQPAANGTTAKPATGTGAKPASTTTPANGAKPSTPRPPV